MDNPQKNASERRIPFWTSGVSEPSRFDERMMINWYERGIAILEALCFSVIE